jgi:hypothetical protein
VPTPGVTRSPWWRLALPFVLMFGMGPTVAAQALHVSWHARTCEGACHRALGLS